MVEHPSLHSCYDKDVVVEPYFSLIKISSNLLFELLVIRAANVRILIRPTYSNKWVENPKFAWILSHLLPWRSLSRPLSASFRHRSCVLILSSIKSISTVLYICISFYHIAGWKMSPLEQRSLGASSTVK
jgi:hypothetical protein